MPASSSVPAPAGAPALVTGGSRGIGFACARALGEAGHPVFLAARSAGPVADAVARLRDAGIRAGGLAADVSSPGEVDALLVAVREAFGPPLVLVNNAGAAESGPLAKADLAVLDRMWQANVVSTWLCTRAALPGMLQAGWGRVVQVASIAGLRGAPYITAYCAAKHAVVGFTRALAHEVASRGVTVNAVCPGYVDTDMAGQAVDNIAARTRRTQAEARAWLESLNPQGRLVEAGEVAAMVAWLVSPAAAPVHGQALGIDGGASA